MEKFINNLYSNSNFPIILISLIIIFIVLFIITLILALKDAKNNSKEEISKEEENKDNVGFKEPVKEETEEVKEPNIFEDVSFDKEEVKEDLASNNDISFEKVNSEEDTKEDSVDVIEETTQTIPVLKDEEISNFEEFFFQNLKDKDNNIFDFSKTETKEEEKQEDNNDNKSSEKIMLNPEVNSDITPSSFEMPKMKKEYTFKELDGETYQLK